MPISNLSYVLLNKLHNNLSSEQIRYAKNLIKKNPELVNVIQYDINKISEINLTPNEIKYIKNLIKNNSEIINIIQDDINKIITNSNFNYIDILSIISELAEIFKNHIVKNNIKSINIINIINFILDSIIDDNLIRTYNLESTTVKIVISKSLDLLAKNININDNGGYTKYFFKYIKSFQ